MCQTLYVLFQTFGESRPLLTAETPHVNGEI